MKKILIGLGLAVSLASTAIAQAPDSARGKSVKGKRGGEHGQMEGRRGRGGPDGLLLKGITLTEGQRTQIAQLRKTQRDQFEGKREANKAEMGKLREARAQHLAAIRNVLTVEQRVQFERNVAELKTREAERAQPMGERGRKGEKAQRPDRRGR